MTASPDRPAEPRAPQIVAGASAAESERRAAYLPLQQASPQPNGEPLANLGLLANRQTSSRVLWIHELYQRALAIHGVIMEVGARWGQNAALCTNLRGIYGPYNYTRRNLAFDTFTGFPNVAA